MAKAPEDCQTMAEVREGVDALDRDLVRLLVTRQGYMHAAARIKPNRDAVYDEARIEDVVSKVVAEARRAGLSPQIAEPVWRKLIERCIAHEFDVWDATRVNERGPDESRQCGPDESPQCGPGESPQCGSGESKGAA